jgi:alkyl hydroperoxide reductase subunit AhpF
VALLRAEEEVKVREWFGELERPVELLVALGPEGFPRFPAVSIRPEGRDVGLRYDGLPWGYELGSIVGAIVEAGREEPSLRPESRAALEERSAISRSTSSSRRPDPIARRPCCWRSDAPSPRSG